MQDKIIKAYWDCPYCDSIDIDGLIDNCPSCGRHKPEDTQYHLKGGIVPGKNISYKKSLASASDILTSQDLEKAGISKEECDGNHKEWICGYCNSLNNYSDKYCTSCGSPKTEADLEYGMQPRITDITNTGILKHETEYYKQEIKHKEKPHKEQRSFMQFMAANSAAISIAAITAFTLILFCILFWPHKEIITVNGFSWERNISIEDYRTVKESGWSVPSGGRTYDTRREVRSYVSVIDHYETVTETKTRDVIDHYETTYTYTDNGNGTFTEHSSQTPVYRTETYTETHEEPVYRQDPVYDTKYYYEIERWVDSGRDYPSSGNDREPYWNEDYTLSVNERDTDRTSHYYTHYDTGLKQDTAYDEWMSLEIGDSFIRTYNILGITYKSDMISP